MSKKVTIKPGFAIAAALVGLVVFYQLRQDAIDAGTGVAKAAGTGLNPLDRGNFLYRGINAVGDTLDDTNDNDSFSLGGWLYDVTHDDPLQDEGVAATAAGGGGW